MALGEQNQRGRIETPRANGKNVSLKLGTVSGSFCGRRAGVAATDTCAGAIRSRSFPCTIKARQRVSSLLAPAGERQAPFLAHFCPCPFGRLSPRRGCAGTSCAELCALRSAKATFTHRLRVSPSSAAKYDLDMLGSTAIVGAALGLRLQRARLRLHPLRRGRRRRKMASSSDSPLPLAGLPTGAKYVGLAKFAASCSATLRDAAPGSSPRSSSPGLGAAP